MAKVSGDIRGQFRGGKTKLVEKQPEVEHKIKTSIPLYRKNWFKRITGATVIVLGILMKMTPYTAFGSEYIVGLGISISVAGWSHAAYKRSSPAHEGTEGVIYKTVKKIEPYLIKLFSFLFKLKR